MQEKSFIRVAIHYSNKVIDLQVPKQVSIKRLKVLLREAFIRSSIEVPTEFELLVLNKPILLNMEHLVSDYPLGDGDQLAIQEIRGETREVKT